MDKKKRRRLVALCVLAAVILFFISPLYPYLRALAVMSVYSPINDSHSLLESEDITLDIPSDENWTPFVMNFAADSAFLSETQLPAKLTILYNFPAFSLQKGCSRLYDESSPYYSSFYGAYLVKRSDGRPFGFSEQTGALDEAAVASVAKFDYLTLVLGNFGLPKTERLFDYTVTAAETGLSFVGYEGSTRVCSDIDTKGVNHKKAGFVPAYLQYGPPNFPVSADFAPITMKSIVYARYFEDWNVSVFFYVMSPSEEVCEACVSELLAKSTLKAAD